MPDPSMPQGGDADPTSSSAPPGGSPPGAVPSGGAGDPNQPSGTMPPTGAPGAMDGNVPPQGLQAMGMEIMRKAMGAIHLGRSLLDPYSEEGKAADTMFRHGAKHFKPDHDAGKQMQSPQMAQGGGGAGAPPGGPPQMASPQGGGGAMPQPSPGPIPSLAGAGAGGG